VSIRAFLTFALLAVSASAFSQDAHLRFSTLLRTEDLIPIVEDEAARQQALDTLRAFEIERVYLEPFQTHTYGETEILAAARDVFAEQGFDVWCQILTASSDRFGVEGNTGRHWLNYEAEKTREDLEAEMRRLAGIFDRIVVGEYFCTNDTSEQSHAAKGDRDWGEYRQDLLAEVAEHYVVGPAREVNPDVILALKFPQGYDRYPRFGYSPALMAQHFDHLIAGCETGDERTEGAFGATQPYGAFLSIRALRDVAPDKVAWARVDHNDTDTPRFMRQLWNAVLGGAREIGLFKYSNLRDGHPSHTALREAYPELRAMATHVREHPVAGIPAYKPVGASAYGDQFLFELLGTVGIPIVPVSEWPESGALMLLAEHAAADAKAVERAGQWLDRGGSIVFTRNFLARAEGAELLIERAGVRMERKVRSFLADSIELDGALQYLDPGLRMSGPMQSNQALTVLKAESLGDSVSFLTTLFDGDQRISVLNVYTYDHEDYARRYDWTRTPDHHGIPNLPRAWADALRATFNAGLRVQMSAPARVTLYPFEDGGCLVYNNRDDAAEVRLEFAEGPRTALGQSGEALQLELPPHTHAWVKRANS